MTRNPLKFAGVPQTPEQISVTVTVTGTAGVKESLLGLDSWIAAAEEVLRPTNSAVSGPKLTIL